MVRRPLLLLPALCEAPLHKLTGKGVVFQWTPACQTAFETLFRKQSVSSGSSVLAMPTDEMCVLDTDASNHSIAYGSRTYSKAEINYYTTQKELLAVV